MKADHIHYGHEYVRIYFLSLLVFLSCAGFIFNMLNMYRLGILSMIVVIAEPVFMIPLCYSQEYQADLYTAHYGYKE